LSLSTTLMIRMGFTPTQFLPSALNIIDLHLSF